MMNVMSMKYICVLGNLLRMCLCAVWLWHTAILFCGWCLHVSVLCTHQFFYALHRACRGLKLIFSSVNHMPWQQPHAPYQSCWQNMVLLLLLLLYIIKKPLKMFNDGALQQCRTFSERILKKKVFVLKVKLCSCWLLRYDGSMFWHCDEESERKCCKMCMLR